TCAFYICQNTQNHNETSNFACGKFKYLDMVIQPRQKMDEREAALTMLKKLAQQEKDFLVLMDRGYISFNLIENCNRLKHCHYVMRSKSGDGAFKEIVAMSNHEYDIDLSCRVTSSHYYYVTIKIQKSFFT
ncbi:hypothetical protein QP535_04840, partial [Lactobacillus crispatus]|uniref:transposase n=1 Tax=Lactobacillus crispatus TaxID=47770 RepID=UPI0032B74D97|nr:hypothetical protein [Lactobacillus crispatus]